MQQAITWSNVDTNDAIFKINMYQTKISLDLGCVGLTHNTSALVQILCVSKPLLQPKLTICIILQFVRKPLGSLYHISIRFAIHTNSTGIQGFFFHLFLMLATIQLYISKHTQQFPWSFQCCVHLFWLPGGLLGKLLIHKVGYIFNAVTWQCEDQHPVLTSRVVMEMWRTEMTTIREVTRWVDGTPTTEVTPVTIW